MRGVMNRQGVKLTELFKRAFLFNGIGSDYEKITAGVPTELFERFSSCRSDVFSRLGLETDIHRNTPFDAMIASWLTSSISDRIVFEAFIEKGIKPDIGAGYSSGIVNICSCFSVFSFDFSYDIIAANRATMLELGRNSIKLDMGVIIGLDRRCINELIHDMHEEKSVNIGSVNSSFCVMITGCEASVIHVLNAAKTEGALRTIKMNTGIAYHSPLLEPYCTEYNRFCASQPYSAPKYPIVSVFSGELLTTGDELLHENIINVTTPMCWETAIEKLEKLGVTEFYDMSADGSVKKFTRLRKKNLHFHTYQDICSCAI